MNTSIVANGLKTNFCLDGPDDAPVVMLSNSLMSNLNMWNAQIPALTARYRVLRYDQRGHGDTEVTAGPYSIEHLAEDAFGLIEALGIASVNFLGLSMGGFTGQLLAARQSPVDRQETQCSGNFKRVVTLAGKSIARSKPCWPSRSNLTLPPVYIAYMGSLFWQIRLAFFVAIQLGGGQ